MDWANRSLLSGCLFILFSLTTTSLVPFGLETAAVHAQDDGTPTERQPQKPKPTEEDLSQLFSASKIEILEDGRVRLTYDFETKEDSLLADWSPDISKTKQRIRWSRGYEGTFSTVEDGLVIADFGMFLHRADWKEDVKMDVSFLSMSASQKNDVVAAVFAYDKGRRIVGSNMGVQCVRMSKNMKHKGAPIPRQAPQLSSNQRINMGLELKDGVLSAIRGTTRMADTTRSKKFLHKLGSGKVGLAWRGRVQGFVFKVVVEGTLDPEWLEKARR